MRFSADITRLIAPDVARHSLALGRDLLFNRKSIHMYQYLPLNTVLMNVVFQQ